jgi:hypothetical protein
VTSSDRLAALGVVVAVAPVVAYALLLRVAIVRNHAEAYVVGFAAATALAVGAVRRAGTRRWPAAALSEAERAGVEIVQVQPDPVDVRRVLRAL